MSTGVASILDDLERQKEQADADGDDAAVAKLTGQIDSLRGMMGLSPAEESEPAAAAEPVDSGRRGEVRPAGADPGDWTCASCGNVNWARRSACNRCQAPKGSGGAAPAPAAARRALVPAPSPGPLPALASAAPATRTVHGPAPRAGDWPCAQCGNINFARREKCNKCQAPRPQTQTYAQSYVPRTSQVVQPAVVPIYAAPSPAPAAGPNVSAGDWVCNSCSNVNWARRTECNKCKVPRPADAPTYQQPPTSYVQQTAYVPVAVTSPAVGVAPPREVREGDWSCPYCGNVNWARRDACNKCGQPKYAAAEAAAAEAAAYAASAATVARPTGGGGPPPRAGDWTCPACGNNNFARRAQCNKCQTPRPAQLGTPY